jgi:hypothetical protein
MRGLADAWRYTSYNGEPNDQKGITIYLFAMASLNKSVSQIKVRMLKKCLVTGLMKMTDY